MVKFNTNRVALGTFIYTAGLKGHSQLVHMRIRDTFS